MATNSKDRRNPITKWMRWTARIWSVPLIAYALLMAAGYTWSWLTTGVADPYAVEDVSFVEALPPILMFVSVLGLGVAWHWEQWGGIITLVFQLVTLPLLFTQIPLTRDFPRSAIPYLMALVVAIPGALFLACGWRSRASNL
ncbi:MAG: hypothetical protein JW934_23635 [Anaerolineae bacterium]|nr:hypothetical protein [Anaerolineae bacterium]